MSECVPITFGSGRTVWVDRGTTVLAAARRAGVTLTAPCAGRGICGGCGVRVTQGELAPPDEVEFDGLRRAPKGVRLACRAMVGGPVSVTPIVPARIASAGVVPDAPSQSLGPLVAAIDLGTSTIAAVLIQEETRVEVGRAIVQNGQVAWGSDVLSRMSWILDADGEERSRRARELRDAAEETILEALGACCGAAGTCAGGIRRLVVAGNTAMSSILLGLDVERLGSFPFAAPYTGTAELARDSRVAAALAPAAETLVLAPLGGFVGGDVLAGLLASGLGQEQRHLFLDLGTNAEIVDATPDAIVAVSAAAGPAFEGVGIVCGGPAVEGAIERVELDASGGVHLSVIGEGEGRWLCGSGLVSLAAGLRRLGHLDAEGRLLEEGPLRDRFCEREGVEALVVSPASDGVPEVILTQPDVRLLQLAKGAVRAGIEVLLERDTGGAPVLELAIAGGFGEALDPRDMSELGVIPAEHVRRARVVGNTSVLGAAMLAVDPTLVDRLERMVARATHVELAADARFGERFLESLSLEPFSLAR